MPRPTSAFAWLPLLVLAASLTAQHEGVTVDEPAQPRIDYLRDVRPILAQHCYECHGPDEEQRKGDLRLDVREGAFARFDDYAIVVAGDAQGSELMQRITTDDPEDVMPPPKCDDALTEREVDVLRGWIEAGADWQEHWAFVPPTRPATPPVQDNAWPKGDIDAFVLAQLEAKGLRPNGEASREAWLRRVTFDLIGLPPTPDELDAFVEDTSQDAYGKVVDRLLADERYGERMATDWLDLARYADSSGYQRDRSREAWKWRDWVIGALNDNMPFDRFTIEQLAGDLLDDATLEQRIATGFNRNHPVNTEAGEELDEYRSAYVIDRVHTTATTWLGLTVACAQCHDHKYDPISQKEFYSFYGFFNNVKEKDNGSGRNPKPAIAAPGPDDLPKLRDLERRIELLKQRLEKDDPLTDRFQADWEKQTRVRLGAPIEWQTLSPTAFMARYGSTLELQDDGSLLAKGPTPSRDTYDLTFMPNKHEIQALRIEALPDPSLPHGASGRADDGRFILSRIETRMTNVSESSDPPLVPFAFVGADVNQERDKDEHYLTAITPGSFEGAVAFESGKESSGGFRGSFGGWSVAGDARKQPREAVMVPQEPLASNETSILRMTFAHTSRDKFRSLLGRFRISFTTDPRIREQLVPLAKSDWHSIGPFPAKSVEAAFGEQFGPEKDLEEPSWKKKHEQPIVAKEEPKAPTKDAPKKPAAGGSEAKPKQQQKADEQPAAKPESVLELFSQLLKPNKDKAAPKPDGKPKGKGEPKGDEEQRKPRPKRIAWQEQTTWRDGSRASLPVQGAASASYVSRRFTTKTARTARIELQGGVAAKVWLNGKLVGDYAPKASEPAAKPEQKPSPKEFDPAMFDPAAFEKMRRGGPSAETHELHIGLRAGENHLVVKLVGKGREAPKGGGKDAGPKAPTPRRGGSGGGSLSFTFSIEAEGDDVLDYETLLAVRSRKDADATSLAQAVPASAAAESEKKDKKKAKTPEQRRAEAVRDWYRRRIDVAGKVLAAELRKLEREKREVESKLPSTLVMEELEEPRELRVFVRGDYRNKGDAVAIDTPSMLPPMPKELPKNRLGLAKWLVSGEHPLTARVTVNRAWQQFFGRGIVATPDDFGIRGAQPSHPKLLDWLACEFVDGGWDLKKLHRAIALSATYRQAAATSKEARAADPDNVLLARGPHQRLAAEMVRDQALAVSGLLKQKIGGESVKPFQPEGLWRATLGAGKWQQSKGEDNYRRGLYVYWKRGVPYPSFMAFDASKRETCKAMRTQTTTPLQALVTLNDPVYVEAGRHLGQRLLKEGGDDDEARIAYGFRLVASRSPERKELQVLGKLLDDLRKHFGKDEDAAKQVLGLADDEKDASSRGRSRRGRARTPPSKEPAKKSKKGAPQHPPAEAAAWAQLGCTLLNLEAAIRRG